MRKWIMAAGAALLVTFASLVLAHPGHGSPEWAGSAFHYLIEFIHLPLIAVMSIFAVITFRWAFSTEELVEELAEEEEN